MATYFSALEAARESLGLGGDLTALNMVLAKHPNLKTEDELANMFATRGNMALSSQQLADLVAIIAFVTPAPIVVEEAPEVDVLDELDDELDEVDDLDDHDLDAPAAPTMASVPVEDEVEPGLNPEDYKLVDIAAGKSDFVSVTTNEAGLFEVTWPEAEGAVFVLAVGEKRFPDSIESGIDEIVVLSPTTKNSRTFSSEYRYVSIFRFDEAGKPGYKVGQGRALGRLLNFEAEANPGRIVLTWETDDPDATVVIFKSEPNQKLPKVPTSEPERKPANSFWNDVMVEVGETFEYRAHLEWRFNQSTAAETTQDSAIQVKVVVPGAVPRFDRFAVVRNPGQSVVSIEISDITKKGLTFEIYQIQNFPGNALLARGNTQFTLEKFEDPLFKSQIGSKINQEPEISDGVRHYKDVPLLRNDGVLASTITYTAVTKLGNDVYISTPFVLQIVDDLKILGLEDFFDYHLMRLEVPTGAQGFEVWITDLDKEFSDVSGLRPTLTFDRGTHYNVYGGLRLENSTLTATPQKIFVRGIAAFFAGQNNAGQHQSFVYPGRVTVRYRKKKLPLQAAPKAGMFGRGKPAAISENLKQTIEVWVDAPRNGINSKNEEVPLTTLSFRQLKAVHPKFPLIKRNFEADSFRSLAILKLADFNATKTYLEVLSRKENEPLAIELPGTNRFIAHFEDAEDIKTRVFVINEDDELAMNGDPQAGIPSRPNCNPNPQRTLKIAIVGAKASGKTTYLSALLQYLEHQFGPSFGGFLEPKPGDKKSEARATQLANFVKDGIALPPTDSATNFDGPVGVSPDDPRTKFNFKIGISPTTPVGEFEFLDLAGEDLATVETLSLYKEGLQAADLIIFLFDPLQVPEVRNMANGLMELPPDNAANPLRIWENLKEVVGPPESRKNPNQKIAITISKFDAITLAMKSGFFIFEETLDSAMAINRDPYAVNPKVDESKLNAQRDFNYLDGGDVHLETRAILKLIGLPVGADLAEDPAGWGAQNVKYFVVSALGQGIKGRVHGLSSFRIGDPIRWALAN